jgi:hypothetical protein
MRFDKDKLSMADAIVKAEAKKLIGKYALRIGTDDTFLIKDVYRLDNTKPIRESEVYGNLYIGKNEVIDFTIMVQLDNEGEHIELQTFQTDYDVEL